MANRYMLILVSIIMFVMAAELKVVAQERPREDDIRRELGRLKEAPPDHYREMLKRELSEGKLSRNELGRIIDVWEQEESKPLSRVNPAGKEVSLPSAWGMAGSGYVVVNKWGRHDGVPNWGDGDGAMDIAIFRP